MRKLTIDMTNKCHFLLKYCTDRTCDWNSKSHICYIATLQYDQEHLPGHKISFSNEGETGV